MKLLPPSGPKRRLAVTQLLGFIVLPALAMAGLFVWIMAAGHGR